MHSQRDFVDGFNSSFLGDSYGSLFVINCHSLQQTVCSSGAIDINNKNPHLKSS